MIYNREDIVAFWQTDNTPNAIYSQWYKAPFTYDGIEFSCCEQFMMYCKAKAFGDDEKAEVILQDTNPHYMKHHGREVVNFKQDVWDSIKFSIVANGNKAKFSQNEELKKALIATGDKVIVEASPFDTIWGIGMLENSPDIVDDSKWQGQNLLGKALMQVRAELIKEAEAEAAAAPKRKTRAKKTAVAE